MLLSSLYNIIMFSIRLLVIVVPYRTSRSKYESHHIDLTEAEETSSQRRLDEDITAMMRIAVRSIRENVTEREVIKSLIL